MVEGVEGEPVLLLVRGDHTLNEVKAEKLAGIKSPLTFAAPSAIEAALAPNRVRWAWWALPAAWWLTAPWPSWLIWWPAAMKNDVHLTGVNWGRDCAEPEVADLRNVVEGDASRTARACWRCARH